MPMSCKLCQSADRETIAAKVSQGASIRSVAETFGVSRSALSRHLRDHGVTPPPTDDARTHRQAVADLIVMVRDRKGAEYDKLDRAEAHYLEGLATALDFAPANSALLREYRLALAGFRAQLDRRDDDAEAAALEALMRSLSVSMSEQPYPDGSE